MKDMSTEVFAGIALAVCVLMSLAFFGSAVFRLQTREVPQPIQPQPALEQPDDAKGLRVDLLGRFTSPGRCVGSICF